MRTIEFEQEDVREPSDMYFMDLAPCADVHAHVGERLPRDEQKLGSALLELDRELSGLGEYSFRADFGTRSS